MSRENQPNNYFCLKRTIIPIIATATNSLRRRDFDRCHRMSAFNFIYNLLFIIAFVHAILFMIVVIMVAVVVVVVCFLLFHPHSFLALFFRRNHPSSDWYRVYLGTPNFIRTRWVIWCLGLFSNFNFRLRRNRQGIRGAKEKRKEVELKIQRSFVQTPVINYPNTALYHFQQTDSITTQI